VSAGYVIARALRRSTRLVTFEIVTDQLQRVAVTVPYRHSTDAEARATIDHVLAARNVRPKPVRSHPNG
jgi:hypothetical protein